MLLCFYIKKIEGEKELLCGQLYHPAGVNLNLKISEYNLPEDTTLTGNSSFGLLVYLLLCPFA